MNRSRSSRTESDLGGQGAFAPRQVIAMMALIVAGVVLAPVGVRAADMLVTIQDPTADREARVDAGGRLRMGDGSGAITVDGRVESTLVPVGSPLGEVIQLVGEVAITEPMAATDRIAITSLTMANNDRDRAQVTLHAYSILSGGNCYDWVGGRQLAEIITPGGQTTHLTYPHPLVAGKPGTGGDQWCLILDGAGPFKAFSWVGYVVP